RAGVLGPFEPEHAAVEDQVLEAGQLGIDERAVADVAETRADLLPVLPGIHAERAVATAVRLGQRGEDAQQRRLSGAVRAEQRHHRAAVGLKIDRAERGLPSVALR